MGASCSNEKASLTNSILSNETKDSKSNIIKDVQTSNKINETLKNKIENEEMKRKELKESVRLKPEPNEIKIDLRRSQTMINNQEVENDIKDSQISVNKEIFQLPINYYTEPGRPHPPFEIINKQLEVSLCRIKNKNNKEGIGFFCAIPFPTLQNCLPVLITNSYILEENEISIGKSINIILNSKKNFLLNINKSRKIYNKNGIIMIEIKDEDKLDINNFLIFDNFNNVNKCLAAFKSQNSYFFRYTKEEKISCCLAIMTIIDNYNYKFMFCIDPAGECSGCPIINENHNVIGIHMKDLEGNYLHEYIREFYELESIKKNPSDEITIIYQIIKELDTKITLFGETFVKNNKDKCKLIIDGKEQDLIECIDNQNNNKLFDFKEEYTEIVIKLKGIKNITDASYMFKDCVALIALPDFGKWDTSKVTNFEGLFFCCWTLLHISNGISNWNTINVKSFYGMFISCFYLMYLPDISKWNTKNLENIEELFHGCESLRKIPDISKWNIEKVKNLNFVFTDCKSLTSLPDISKWNTSNVTELIGLFEQCESLESLPDISIWNTDKITNLDGVFNLCKSLTSLPDISKWNTSNVTSMRFLFQSCTSLTHLPDISKWNTDKVTTMEATFNLCVSLIELPDLSKWNTSKVTNMFKLFNMCENLQSFPNILEWNLENVTNKNNMFTGCYAAGILESYK